MLSQYKIQNNNNQNSVLLLYSNMYRLLVGANPDRNVGIAKREDNSSICCSVQHMCIRNSTTLLSNGISIFLAIVIWLVDHKPENSSKYCHSINTIQCSFWKICFFVGFIITYVNSPPCHIKVIEHRTEFFLLLNSENEIT